MEKQCLNSGGFQAPPSDLVFSELASSPSFFLLLLFFLCFKRKFVVVVVFERERLLLISQLAPMGFQFEARSQEFHLRLPCRDRGLKGFKHFEHLPTSFPKSLAGAGSEVKQKGKKSTYLECKQGCSSVISYCTLLVTLVCLDSLGF